MPECRKCLKSFPNRVEIEGKTRVVSGRKFCLDCSPFMAHNTKSNLNYSRPHSLHPLYQWCPRCEKPLELEKFYKRSDGRPTPYCKKCTSEWSQERCRSIKAEYVAYKGGSCGKCGYSKSLAALDFHHTDPSKKDPDIFRKKSKSVSQDIKRELDKCILVCSNCHREEHERLALAGLEPTP